jgi:hypothetical protein
LEFKVRNSSKKLLKVAEIFAISPPVSFSQSPSRPPKFQMPFRSIESSFQFNESDNSNESDIEEISRISIKRFRKNIDKKITITLEIHLFKDNVKASSVFRNERRHILTSIIISEKTVWKISAATDRE